MTWSIRGQSLAGIRRCCLFTAGLFLFVPAAFSQSRPAATASSAPAEQSAISVATNLVVLPVRVTDGKGNVVLGLKEEDFRVYEDGQLQKITMFEQRDSPVTVGLIVDHSRSMGPELPEVAAAVSAFAQSSNPRDEMFVVDFNDDVSVELLGGKAFTNDPKELALAVSAVRARGRTALYDAVAEGLLHVQLGHGDRKALIIVSDGGDNASQQKLSQVLALAKKSQVAIYCIGLISETGDANPGVLRRLSKGTGGKAYFPDATNSVTSISARIARDLRDQYTLGFTPEGANKSQAFRKIEVKVAGGHGKIQVQTRAGYFPTEAKPAAAPATAAKGAE